jgi:TonB family protein
VKKSELYGATGSGVFMMLLLLLLLLIVLPGNVAIEEEGIMVSFGSTIDGSSSETRPEVVKPEVPTPQPSTTKPVKEDLVTQDDNSVAIAEEKKRKKAENEALERARLEQIRLENERKRKEQEAIDNANDLMGSMGNSTSTGNGTTTGNTNQGNPLGSGTSGGNSWSLNGRSLSGRLAQPSYESNVEGRITVSIRVDASGRVTSASIGSPTNISDTKTRNAAIAAAQSTKFSSGNNIATGSITYNFKLR